MISYYTVEDNGWGILKSECEICHEIVAEYTCDAFGIPEEKIFDNSESHDCNETIQKVKNFLSNNDQHD